MDRVVEVKERLVKEDAQFRRLVEEHQEFEKRLGQLQSRRWLSDEEQLEEIQIKKKKLAIKDQMEKILRGEVS